MLGEIVQATRAHAIQMAPRMRTAEVDEVRFSHGFTPLQALEHELEQSVVAWSWIVHGEVACMFGIAMPVMLSDCAYPWMLSTEMVNAYALEFARGCRQGLPYLLSTYGTLNGMVDARYGLSIRWLEWLGFTVGEPVPHGPEGALFRPFTIDRSVVDNPSSPRASKMTITHATIAEIESSPNFGALLAEYGAESANHEIGAVSPQMGTYRMMEASGTIRVFTARENGKLVGFLLLLLTVLPHFGRKVGVVESYFVASKHRKSGAGLGLLRAAEDAARTDGADGLLVSAPIGGALERVMPGIGYRETNRVFFKGMQ